MQLSKSSVEGFGNVQDLDIAVVPKIGSSGPGRSGKTGFACTMPGRIGVLPFDPNCGYTTKARGKALGKEIVLPKRDISLSSPEDITTLREKQEAAKKRRKARKKDIEKQGKGFIDVDDPLTMFYEEHLGVVLDLFWELVTNPAIDSIVIDTASRLFELVLLATFGRTERIMPIDRGIPNARFCELINAVNKPLMLIHYEKEVWKANKPTGLMRMSGYPRTDYLCNIMLEHFQIESKIEANKLGKQFDCDAAVGDFGVRVLSCTANPVLAINQEVFVGAECSFVDLALAAYVDSSESDWE